MRKTMFCMTTLLWYWERKNIILAHLYYFVSVHSTDKQKDTDVKEHANYYFSVLLKYIFSGLLSPLVCVAL